VLERDTQLSTLASALSRARGGAGRLGVVEAAAGLGKTTLLEEFVRRASTEPIRVLTARAAEQERSFGYGVVRALFEPVLRDAELPIEGAAAAVLSPAAAGHYTPDAVLYGLYWLVSGLARQQPTVIVVDDAHDADDASLQFLCFLTRRLADLPVVLVVATRPRAQAGPNQWLDELGRMGETIALAPLSHRAIAAVVADRLSGSPEPAFVEACREATGGNPFYLRELLAAAGRHGWAPSAEAASWVGELGPPALVRGVLLVLGTLTPGSVELARACAILGSQARLHDCAAVADLDPGTAARAADALVGAEILRTGPHLDFTHPILRSAVLADIGDHQQAQWHARAARHLRDAGAPVQRIAGHLLRTTPGADPAVVACLREAAEHAMSTGSPDAAAAYLNRALEETPGNELRSDLLSDLGSAELLHGRLEALDHLRASIESTAPGPQRARRCLVLAEAMRKIGATGPALDLLDEAVRADPSGQHAEIDLEHHWIARTSLDGIERAGDGAAAYAAALASTDAALRMRAHAYLAVEAAIAVARGTSRDHLARLREKPGLLDAVAPDSPAVSASLLAATITEDHAAFDDLAGAAFSAAGLQGNLVGHLIVSIYQGMEHLRRGRYAAARDEAAAAMALAELHGWPQGVAEFPAVHVAALVELGDLDAAAATLADTPFAVDDPRDYPSLLLLDARAQLHLARGNPQAALADLLACGERADVLGLYSPAMLGWRIHIAFARRALGQRDEAVTVAHEAVELADRLAGPITSAAARRALARAVGGADGVEHLREAAELLSDGAGAGEQAHVTFELGAALRRAGRVTDARTHLAAALDGADRAGMLPLAAAVKDELHAAGAKPRRTRLTGVAALTPAETRVARLAAAGSTNPEIARTVFVSLKTVEKHLGSAYGKLGISSRRELAGIDLDG
jgi:DNA-binding CsgD family transcriptional regulator